MARFVAQNGTEYEVWLARDTGTRIALLDDLRSIDYAQALNDPGRVVITLPYALDPLLIRRDRRIVIYRKPAGGVMRRDFAGLLTWVNFSGGVQTITTLAGPGLGTLLRRRIVAYPAGSAQASKAGAIGDLMKAIVRENLGDEATDPDRAIAATTLRVDPDAGDGPTMTRSFAWRRVHEVLGDLSDAARQNGTEIYYAIEADDERAFTFRTWAGQPGRERDLTLSVDDEMLLNPSLTINYDEEINFAYAGGQGEEADRMMATASDAERIGLSVFGRSEGFADARNESMLAGVQAAADGLVSAGRPAVRFSAEIGNRLGCAYGVDWVLGDRLPAAYLGQIYACLVRSVRVQVAAGGDETVSARLETTI